MNFRLGETHVKIHPLLPFLWLSSFVIAENEGFSAALLAFLCHEGGHMLMARLCRMKVNRMEITPFGGVMALEDFHAASPLVVFLIAGAGPFASLIGCALTGRLYQSGLFSFSFAAQAVKYHMLLLFVNLLPALPLDGGKMTRALLSKFASHHRINQWLGALGYLLGGIFCCFTIVYALQGKMVLAPIFMGLYLMYASAQEQKSAVSHYVTALIARRQRLEGRETLPVEIVAAAPDMPAQRLLGRLNAGKLHIIHVLSRDGMEIRGSLSEKQFCEGILNHPHKSLYEMLETKK